MAIIGHVTRVPDAELRRWKRSRDPSQLVDDRATLDLDTAWHAVHHIISGVMLDESAAVASKQPLSFLVNGGRLLGMIAGTQARAFDAAACATIAGRLREVDAAHAVRSTHLSSEVYPGSWQNDANDHEYCLSYLEALRGLLDEAVREGQGIVVWYS